MAYLTLAASILLTVLGQLLMRWRMGGRGGSVLAALLDPWVIAAAACWFVAMLAWMATLARLPLTVAYPASSLAYPLVLIAAVALFREPLDGWRLAGVGLIMAGVTLCGIGAGRSA